MFFCPKCNFSLDISKNIPPEISNNIEIKFPKDLIDLILDNEIESQVKISFSKKDLQTSKEFKNLEEKYRNQIEKKFDEINNKSYNLAYFVCNNCQFVTKLEAGTKLYEVTTSSNYSKNDIIENKIPDNTLPRTKDYICPNKNCKSRMNDKNKEAIFYRVNKESYNLKYVCTLCNTSWLTGGQKAISSK